jgi:hypothetical protein
MAAVLLLRTESGSCTQAVDRAMKAAHYSAGCQRPDGSWPYGEGSGQPGGQLNPVTTERAAPIDAIRDSREFTTRRRGFASPRALPARGGAARYFHDNTFPIDIHCVAQTILTFLEFSDIDPDAAHQAQYACEWALENMWDERGYFHYRKLRFGSIRTSYMRWSQAWMLLALATLAAHRSGKRP